MIPKFRAFHKKEKKMFEVNRINFRDNSIIVYDRRYPLKPTYVRNGVRKLYLIGFDPCVESDVILMQSTGLKDKNGKEIFEGDIVKESPNGHKGIIIKSHGNFYVDWSMDKNDWCEDYPNWSWEEMACDEIDRIKVIGNVHANPELLEVKE